MQRNTVIEDIAWGPTPYSKADDLIEKAWEAKTLPAQAKNARKALDADLDSIDGYILLSHSCETLGEKLALLREAVRVGDRLWQRYIGQEDMVWWGFIGTRPYLRALHELGLACQVADDFADARACYAKLLELNPNDNQGVRELLVHLYLLDGQNDEAKAVLDRYTDDMLLGMELVRFIHAITTGDNKAAERIKVSMAKANEHVLPMLGSALASKVAPVGDSSGYVTLGSTGEAASVIDFHWALLQQPKIKKILLAALSDQPKVATAAAKKPTKRAAIKG